MLLVYGNAFAVCDEVPSWALGRTTDPDCFLQVASGIGIGTVTFDDEKSYGDDGTAFQSQCGSDETRCNSTFFEWKKDGYSGTAVTGTSCLLGNTCGQGPKGLDADLTRIWTSMRADVILWKSLTLINAWKACIGCTESGHQPHVDNLQAWGANNEILHYFIVQDTIFRNSDDQQLHSTQLTEEAGDILAIVFQNVSFEQESLFADECVLREINYPLMDGDCGGGPNRFFNNGASQSQEWDIWLIDVEMNGLSGLTGGSSPSFKMNNRVILVDTPTATFNASDHDGTVVEYDDIEAALSAGETEPPFLALSCAGWASPPAGCVSTKGVNGVVAAIGGVVGGSITGGRLSMLEEFSLMMQAIGMPYAH